MKLLLPLLFLLVSCSSQTIKSEPTEFKTGKKVAPPYGCIELRKAKKDANC